MKPVISIVSGTYNRLPYLQAMVTSAVNAFPSISVPYEFVIVDGGSDDGTLAWLREQTDVHVIEDGDLLGAISAFSRGAMAARGDYVVLANDDIAFYPESITRALVYLEDHPTCGAVAFADNRGVDFHRVQLQKAHTADGREIGKPYAQVGMFRKWLGDAVGWWGWRDAIMRQARTYGGDNFLSARIWEMGYRVDGVHGAQVDDYMVYDGMRAYNIVGNDKAQRDGALFHQRFPDGHALADAPQLPNPQERQVRILYMPVFEPGHPFQRRTKRGLREALMRVGLVYELDYLDTATPRQRILDTVAIWQPDLILMQAHDARTIDADLIRDVRAEREGVVIVNWNGDAFRALDDDYAAMLREVDLHTVVDANALDACEHAGIRVAYWQIGYEEPFGPVPDDAPAHDVVFLGNNYNGARANLERTLRGTPYNVGLYGVGWKTPNGNTLYHFSAGVALYQRAKIAVGDTFAGSRAFVSNRLFQALAAGAFLLQQEITEFARYNPGLCPGEHFITWTDLDDLQTQLDVWMPRERERQAIAQAGREAVERHYSFDAQLRKLFAELLPEVARERT